MYLFSDNHVENTQGWRADDLDSGIYLEVDLGSRLPVYAIEIAGCPVSYEFVKSFKLQYSIDGVTFYSAYASSGSKVRLDHPPLQITYSSLRGRPVGVRPSWHPQG